MPSVEDSGKGIYFVTMQELSMLSRDSTVSSILSDISMREPPFPNLELGMLLGKGGYGSVYRGTFNGQPCAVKVSSPLPKAVQSPQIPLPPCDDCTFWQSHLQALPSKHSRCLQMCACGAHAAHDELRAQCSNVQSSCRSPMIQCPSSCAMASLLGCQRKAPDSPGMASILSECLRRMSSAGH